ncbi:flagellar hook-associated protein FlgK [bacterium SCSIO 12696]|nr:flagellar hook-associated protein FlgK [bacterium SCSIO 12696]
MPDVFGIGVSALNSLQRAITTTGHNIANANTEGYSRQQVTFGTLPPQQEGNSFIGSGTSVQSIRRAYDEFLGGELLSRQSSFNSLRAYHDLATRLDNLVADQDSGLNVSIQAFFQSLQDVANDPTSLPAREVLLGRAQALENRVGYLNQSLDSLENASNQQLRSTVAEINALASSLASVNQDVSAALVSNPNNPPNDLLDERDRLLSQLSEKVGITSIQQGDGSLNVLIGSGQPLVVGGRVQRLDVAFDPLNPNRLDITFEGLVGNSDVVSSQIRGGEIQGILDFRRQVLDPVRGEVGLLVQGLTDLVNQQHRSGLDLNGLAGGDFFAPIAPQTVASSNNLGSAAVTVAIDDVGALLPTDYNLSFDGAQWQLRNLADNSVQSFASLPQTVAGLTIANTGTPTAGDEFLLRPVGASASRFSVQIERPEQFAAAGLIRAQATVSNGGDASISRLTVGDVSSLPLAAPITLTFDPNALGAGVPGFTVTGGPGGTLAYDPTTESAGKTFTLTGFGNASFDVSGIPQNGDTLTIQNNTGAVGDNSNALSIAGLQESRLLNGGTNSFSELYGRTVATVGVRTSQAQSSLATEQALLNNAEAEVQGVSGVNLDEEAANLLRYQQAYQAAAQIISAASQLFDTLLSATRR